MALIPPSFLNTVVALGRECQDGTARYNATGFLYGIPSGDTDENGKNMYHPFLVTNRHVFEGIFKHTDTLCARFNKRTQIDANVYTMKEGNRPWTVHPDPRIDVAVLEIDLNSLRADGIEYAFFPGDTHALTLEQARSSEISEGDGVFVLGFPLGDAGDERNYPIVRQGIIARIQNWLRGDARTFLIDASIFPGNSGGPVLLKPEIASIQGTQRNDRCVLIGMVSSYLPYQEVAISNQTGRTRMIFEENSGLGTVVPHDAIQKTIRIAVDNLSSSERVAAPEEQTE